MKLYYSPGACSLAPHILMNELKVPCEYIAVNLGTHKTATGEDFTKINPKGAVPCLILKDGTMLTEGAVIQQYLADTHPNSGLLPPVGDMRRYQVLAWLNYITTDLHKGFSPLFNSKVPQEVKDQVFKPLMAGRFAFLNEHFKTHAYLAGDQFSLPDPYLFTVVGWSTHVGLSLTDYPYLTRYIDHLRHRPSVSSAMKEEGLAA